MSDDQDTGTHPSDEGNGPEHTTVWLTQATRDELATVERRIEAAEDTDMTTDEAVQWLLENAPDPFAGPDGDDT